MRDIEDLVNKIDKNEYQSTFTKLLERLDSSLYRDTTNPLEDPNDPRTWNKVKERIKVLSLLSGVDEDHFEIYEKLVQDERDSTVFYVVIYLVDVTSKQYDDVLEVKKQLGSTTGSGNNNKNGDDDKDDNKGKTDASSSAFIIDMEEIMNSLENSGFGN